MFFKKEKKKDLQVVETDMPQQPCGDPETWKMRKHALALDTVDM